MKVPSIFYMLSKRAVHRALLTAFVTSGRAPTVSELRDLLAADETELVQALRELETDDAIVRAEGTGEVVVAYPFSTEPSPHKVTTLAGRTLFCMCAIDALGVHFMLREPVLIESLCPWRETAIRIELRDGELVSTLPPTVVVWRTRRRSGEAHDATTCCQGTRFFSSPRALDDWLGAADRTAGDRLSLRQAADRGGMLFSDLLA